MTSSLGQLVELRGGGQPGGEFHLRDVTGLYGGSNIWYVDGRTGTNSVGNGQNPTAPFDTLVYALVNASTIGIAAGDSIVLLPGHAESVISAALLNMNLAGLRVIGVGEGNLIPTITLGTADTATIQMTAASTLYEHVKMISDIADLALVLDIKATAVGSTVRDCWFTDGASDKEIVRAISIETAIANVTIEGCRIHTVVGGDCADGVVFEGTSTDCIVRDNVILGDWTAGPIQATVGAGVNMVVSGNRINNADASAGLGISLKSDTTGAVYDNYVLNAKPNDPGIIAAACMVTNNLASNVAGAQGIPIPVVDT